MFPFWNIFDCMDLICNLDFTFQRHFGSWCLALSSSVNKKCSLLTSNILKKVHKKLSHITAGLKSASSQFFVEATSVVFIVKLKAASPWIYLLNYNAVSGMSGREGPQSWLELGDLREIKKKCAAPSENDKAQTVCTVQVKSSNAVWFYW